MSTELQDAAAGLIADLPEEAGDLRLPQLRRLVELRESIAAAMEEAAHLSGAMVDRAEERQHEAGAPPDARIGDYLTAVEAAEWERSERRYLDAERAAAALDGWADRSGYNAMGEELTGRKPPEPLAMSVIEDPDGSLLLYAPDDAGAA